MVASYYSLIHTRFDIHVFMYDRRYKNDHIIKIIIIRHCPIVGEWQNNMRHGKGTQYDAKNKTWYRNGKYTRLII